MTRTESRTDVPSGELLEQRHQLEDPRLEAALRRLAVEHPERCTRSTGQRSEGVSV